MRPAEIAEEPASFFARLVGRVGEPVVRAALRQAMRILGQQFVMGETIEAALRRAAQSPELNYSFDMLGEAALTAADAERYFAAYGARDRGRGRLRPRTAARCSTRPSVSVKLSALCPRYEVAQSARAVRELAAKLAGARRRGARCRHRPHRRRRGGGPARAIARDLRATCIATRACATTRASDSRCRRIRSVRSTSSTGSASSRAAAARTIPVRLVKGAYWDSEIKRAQELGLDGYPVFTRKCNTDVSYLACAKALLTQHAALYPQFATHNAHTVAWLLEVGRRPAAPFELQRLHGMGEELYGELLERPGFAHRCPRLRARRQSRALVAVPRAAVARERREHVVRESARAGRGAHRRDRRGSRRGRACVADGCASAHPAAAGVVSRRSARTRAARISLRLRELETLAAALDAERRRPLACAAAHRAARTSAVRATSAAIRRIDAASSVSRSSRMRRTARRALDAASAFARDWSETPAEERAALLRRAADLVEADRAELVARCVAETGKTIPDSLAEVREAVDLLRYYAAEAERVLATPTALPGPTGERNRLELDRPRRVLLREPVEFPARDLHGAGGGGARGRQHRASRSRPSRARWSRRAPSRCSSRPASRRARCSSCPATAARSARRCCVTRASPASLSRARSRRHARSIRRSRAARARSRR